MTSLKDFTQTDGSIDWSALHTAELNAGELCTKCRCMIFPGKGHRTRCWDCEQMLIRTDDIRHESCIRCPHCRHQMDVSANELYDLYEDGEHTVTCTSCEEDFQVETTVTYSFKSPALKSENTFEEDD